ncbi:Uncharacterized protein LW94_12200 [Fusarium fujikuroi]|nr:Uncharacterized protein LW94_12200 [Fusarium fujikuroi]
MQLVQFGWWNESPFFGSVSSTDAPFFGLCKLNVIRELQGDDSLELGFRYIPKIGSQLNLRPEDAIVVYSRTEGGETYVEWATLFPVSPLALGGSATTIDIEKSGERCTIVSKDILAQAITFEQPNHDSMKCTWDEPPPLFGRPASPTRFLALNFGTIVLGATEFRLLIRESRLRGKIMRALASHSLRPGLDWLNNGPDVDAIIRYLKLYQPSVDQLEPIAKRRAVDPDSARSNSLREDKIGKFPIVSKEFLKSLHVLELAGTIYQQLPTATVSLKVIDQDLSKAHWVPVGLKSHLSHQLAGVSVEEESLKLPRRNAFAAIAMFESGFLNIDTEQLSEVVALCFEDSIFVSGILLSDPATESLGISMRHLVGNIGQAGMVFMVAPMDPRIRHPTYDSRLVGQHSYDGKCTDKFGGTSLHLSFTNWKFALDWNNAGEIDQQAFLLESVISVQDKGKWVADIDVLELESSEP